MSARFVLRRSTLGCALLAIAGLCATAHGGDRFVSVPWSGLRFEGEAPELPPAQNVWWATRTTPAQPYVVLDGGGEVFLHHDSPDGAWEFRWMQPPTSISIRTGEEEGLKGRLFLPSPDSSSTSVHRFEVARPDTSVDARMRFYEDMAGHYGELLWRTAPGAAWFRHRRNEAWLAIGQTEGAANERGLVREPADPLDLFSGARAVAENLDLDRTLRVASAAESTVDVTTIEGVSTRSLDWKGLIEGKEPVLDSLARLVPADQHAVFFPTFESMVRVFDEADAQGTPLLEFFAARVEDLRTKQHYQDQMLLPLSTVGRLLGPTVVSSVALTGSDPFLPSGTDVVLLFECKQPALLESLIAARQAEAEKHGAKGVEGSIGDVRYDGVVSSDRRVSSYRARFDSTVAVTNSLVALKRVAQVAEDTNLSLLSADEYVWFRDRYPRADGKESALLVLTDATIRRWAGPRARIADARRLRAAAAMAEIQARHVDALVAGTIEPGKKAADAAFPVSADFVWTENGVWSPAFGHLGFLTPVCELDVSRVSPEEKQAYDVFRSRFQTRWRNYFDPIAVRFELDGHTLRADATIRPLTLDTEYKEIDDLTRGAVLPPEAGDPHASALFHLAIAFNPTSQLGRLFASGSGGLASRFGPDPLAWLGSSIAIYGERDPWWDQSREARARDAEQDVDYYAIPLALRLAVKDPLKLAGFLTALRGLADESAPNIVTWESRTWQETGYVRVGASEESGLAPSGRQAALYYVPFSDALVLSPREDLVKQAIERRNARKAGETVAGGDRTWLGQSAGLRLDHEAIGVIEDLDSSGKADRAALAAWSALPILDEWKRRYPGQDPVAVHQRLWGVRLAAPAGGSFVWDEELHAMVSSDYGRPGAPRPGPAKAAGFDGIQRAEFGLTFEAEGLRAVVEIHKRP